MRSEGILKHFVLAFLLAIAGYVLLYTAIQWRRTRNGPWQVTFQRVSAQAVIAIDQPALQITNFQVRFTDSAAVADTPAAGSGSTTITFEKARPVPFDVPFGRCVFLDTSFLPGSVKLELHGHEITLLPRTLTVDGTEYPWSSRSPVMLR